MIIENKDKNQFLELGFKYKFDDYITYNLEGKNNTFSGRSTVCFHIKSLIKFKADIIKIESGNIVKINDSDSDSFIEVKKIDSLGHYKIIYQIGGTHQDNYCKLLLETDKCGIDDFKGILGLENIT